MQKKAAKRLRCRAMSHSPCSWIGKLSQNVIPVFGLHSNPHALKGTLRRLPLTSNSDAENARKACRNWLLRSSRIKSHYGRAEMERAQQYRNAIHESSSIQQFCSIRKAKLALNCLKAGFRAQRIE